MKTLPIVFAILLLFAKGAYALDADMAKQTCRDLELKMSHPFTNDVRSNLNKPGVIERFVGQGPLLEVLESSLEGLDTESKTRIRWPLAVRLVAECTSFKEEGWSQDVFVGEALEEAVQALGLNKQSARWGLVPLDGVDFEKQTCLDLVNSVKHLGAAVYTRPINDPVVIAGNRVFSKYDLSTPEGIEKSIQARKVAFLSSIGDEETPCVDHFAKSAEAVGLKLK